MLALGIDVPRPSQYVSHKTVDDLALESVRLFRSKHPQRQHSWIDTEAFLDYLEISTVWEDIEEPEGAAFFASFCADSDGLVTINEKHREFFDSRPDVYSACLGHEAGHCVLKHWESGGAPQALSLFEDSTPASKLFHKSSWLQYGLSRNEVRELKEAELRFKQTLARSAFVSPTARETLKQLTDYFEPEWMFWQAEHFSLCLRIPRDTLKPQLEEGWNFNTWTPIYRLAERFRVSPSMMRLRLEKLGVIEIGADGRPHQVLTTPNLFQ